MKRLLANSLMLVGGMTLSSQLLALGLGELNLKSALNQPLQAEIELIDASGLTQWEIKPSLASAADFERAGVDRLFFFSNMTFRVEGNRILVTSREPVTEPFLNFLVEVNWPAGRMLREYTVLLDPPTFDEPQFQPLVSAPATATLSETEVAARPTPVVASASPANPWLDEPAAAGTYKVQKDDTLWEIALQTRPDARVSVQQMMLAIQQENPNAFIGGNINRLKTHQVLNIPDAQTVQRMSQGQAVAEVARQNQALTAGAAQIDATGRNTAGTASSAAQTGGEVRLVAPVQTQADSAGASGDVAAQGGRGREQALENDLAISLENLDKARLENQELRERLESLEEQINTLQRLLTLKDDQLALIQADDGVPVETVAQEDVTSTASNDADVAATASESAADFNYQPAAPAVTDEETVEQRRERMAALLAAQEAEEQANKKGPLDALLQRPEWLGGLAALLVLLAALAYRLVKRRTGKNEDDIESLTDVEAPVFAENDSNLEDFDFDHDDVLVQDDAQSASDFDDIELDGLDEENDSAVAQTDDVISESDIYIAYGKFEQAIALLSNAIAAEPSRSDLRLKLLEVYVEMDDGDAFAIAESDLQTLGDRQADQHAQSMRQRLSSPVVPAAAVASAASAEHGLSLDSEIPSLSDDLGSEFDDGLDFGDALDLDDSDDLPVLTDSDDDLTSLDSTASSLDDVPTLDVDEPIDDALDFSLDDDEEETASVTDATDTPEAVLDLDTPPTSSDDIEFDLSQFDAVESEPVNTLDTELSSPVDEDDYSLAFDLSDAELSTTEESVTAPTVVEADKSVEDVSSLDDELSFDEEDFELGSDLEGSTDNTAAASNDLDALESLLDGDSEGDADLTDLSFDMDETGFADAHDAVADLSVLDAELSSSASAVDTLTGDDHDVVMPADTMTAVDMPSDVADEQEDDFSFDELDALAEIEESASPSADVLADDETLDFAADLAELDSELGDFDESELAPDSVDSVSVDSAKAAVQTIDLDALAEADDEFDYLAGTDECATKLDLARAYIDMEDADGARELLQEVLQEGSDQQKQEARGLMDDLA
ncbi:MAG: hypothetical protein IBX52_05970 [Bacterioplanes sp.]|nr:hypothetical protein [Bacterioplanes sp.]